MCRFEICKSHAYARGVQIQYYQGQVQSFYSTSPEYIEWLAYHWDMKTLGDYYKGNLMLIFELDVACHIVHKMWKQPVSGKGEHCLGVYLSHYLASYM